MRHLNEFVEGVEYVFRHSKSAQIEHHRALVALGDDLGVAEDLAPLAELLQVHALGRDHACAFGYGSNSFVAMEPDKTRWTKYRGLGSGSC